MPKDKTLKKYDFKSIEEKWQKKWEKWGIFRAKDGKGKKFYVLEMYPYPSSSGLHVGHTFNYVIGDIYARFKRMQGFDVLYPFGYDSFGLPAENAAIKEKVHPKKYTDKSISNFMKQQKSIGFSYDWKRVLWSHDPEYYKWNQFFFLKFLENGLAYRKKSFVNWCSKCKSVLANEQVHQGKCWRHSNVDVEKKQLEQWFVKTTAYADEILEKIDSLDWPEHIKTMQRNWIGKSYGYEIDFEVNGEIWPVFTTRAETIFGATFLTISAQHPQLMKIVTKEQKAKVEKFLKKIRFSSEKEKNILDKEGVFTGSYAINPINKEKIPIWVGNFVVADYGSGMIMGVPAHDSRDFGFAKKYDLPIKVVVKSEDKKIDFGNLKEAYAGVGVLVNSKDFDGLFSDEAKEHITKFLESKKLGKKSVQNRMRDWLISRQRYWGTPIPIIYCDKCGVVPVPESKLPVKLPEKVKFGRGNPLEINKNFVNVVCPKCRSRAKRETDTMDTFFDSSWYYLRFCDSKNKKKPFEKKRVDFWMPVNQYIGGAVEHACMHLIYARFFTKALRDLGFLDFDEPFLRLFGQGLIHGKDGYVMSKSRGNVVDPLEIVKKYGADSLRMYLVSTASLDKSSVWNTSGLESIYKFLNRIFLYFDSSNFQKNKNTDEKIEHKLNKAVKEITKNIENFQYNLAIIRLRELFNNFSEKKISKDSAEIFLKILNVFCPHLAEELWHKLGNKSFMSKESWPVADERKILEKIDREEEIVENFVRDVLNILRIIKEKTGKEGKKVFLYVLPNERSFYNDDELSTRLGRSVEVYAVNNPKKYDPEAKSKKAKPGKPGIYVE